ncbi:RNA polymerase sigma-70 factor (ECF subfamily) [Dysgonomonas sp. PFB1-18]|uniref:RNA polymerase sigma factor n=1 Tax=unclassified Dysgonomonas TaxID=2630389 RepID=UPI0024772BB2|nr:MULTISPECIES: RNA polymerase sigma-70 factor [unclassified Dysgonomonas]MDH6307168.1 RNA polymerase sigma-70 factor (ECF subfamily) [Dysgonomonas sp. PF1-14]MDH6337087.1 RNA polymerase sigma-70 factor (ECF subfamily) [Dysgonomonas sp. PF1-16]MDH6381073.1 RNA polymerase sigma-70 factor (ECF subfamily) [Dysgonomonas sp. PFB1-18]MDH6396348.1 RNA polymerase sigma-70 factor (ECF subfamily) [Dysgonomonas sp. PF1-23]
MDEFELFERIKQRDRLAFDTLFRKYYTALCRFSYAICLSKEDAEESIQSMFVYLWEKAPAINIDTSLKAYLYTSARNYTLNIIKKQQTELHHLNEYSEYNNPHEPEEKASDAEISKLIQSGVDTLPNKCREIFILCKQEGLTYDEIAEYLDISKKTIDNQMGIALRKLREYLHPKLGKIVIILFFYFLFWG